MKKKYVSPEVIVFHNALPQLLAGSGTLVDANPDGAGTIDGNNPDEGIVLSKENKLTFGYEDEENEGY